MNKYCLPTYLEYKNKFKTKHIYDYYDRPLFFYGTLNNHKYLFIWNDDHDYWVIKLHKNELSQIKKKSWHECFINFIKQNRVFRMKIASYEDVPDDADDNAISYRPFDTKIDNIPLPTDYYNNLDLTKGDYDNLI